ncbi:putative bifunctional diguanylate cyclase/phosphodiesterase [Actinoplanes rectilineatus]|uniref:putative bifunctional diguanylate cyclase/phosphodiesterase n=1 Tax=Actinoplanes rectilineatus TaxID=113571 RepID=UPI000A66F9B2|nr:EAL domain-containing protein [Actinoplanes rectilineatus]
MPRIAACLAAAAVLLAGACGLMSPPMALALAVGGTALWTASRLGGFAAAGTLFAAVAASVPWWDRPLPLFWLTVALTLATACSVVGVSLLPGATPSWQVRIRRAFDGVGLAVSIGFALYLLPGTANAAAPAMLIAAGGACMVVVIVLRADPRTRSALWTGGGAALVLVSLGALAELMAAGAGARVLPLAGLPMVAGMAVLRTADGAAVQRREPRHPDQYLASYPLLAAPAAVGVLAALWHLLTVRDFNNEAVVFGLVMVSVLTVREMLVVRDIRRYASRLRVAEAHFRSLVAGATDLTLVLDEQLTVRWQSPAAARLFGLRDEEVIGREFADLIHPEDVADARAVICSVLAGEHEGGPPVLLSAKIRDGAKLWRDTESTISDQRDVPEVGALVVHVRDVGERVHLERALHRLSFIDQLTGLANRPALMRDLLERRRRPGRPGTLLVIDLHGLAEVNDTHGREVGDAVLIEVSRRIRGLVGGEDVPARLAGDEFAVLTGESAVPAYALATRIVAALGEPCRLPGAAVILHTSVGLAELSGGADSDEVLRHADLARQRARQIGRDRVEWYDTDVEIQLHRRMELEHQLLGAAARGELDLAFQPVTGLRDGRPAGVEALLRWRHPQLGTILPGELLPIASSLGITAELDEWVLDEACRHLAGWSGDDDFWLSVNVGPRELLTARFPERVAETLKQYRIRPERLVVEVAETWIAEDVPAIVAALSGLGKLGVRAALDDFGAGQTSLSHLRRLPVDMLKLSPALLAEQAEGSPAVLDVVVSLGRRLGLEIVAKGLETSEQKDRALAAGCAYGQGNVLGRPAPAERMEAYLESHRT